MKRLLIPATILVCVSTVFAVITFNWTWAGFIKWFTAYTVLQFVLHYFINQFLNTKYGTQLSQVEAVLAEELNKNEKTIECPCPNKNKQQINISLDKSNTYTCSFCKKEVSVVVDVSTAMATAPIDLIKTDITIKP